MTAAAFRGTYADWKLIKTRGVVQIVLEVPLAASGQAYDVLGGMPNAANEIWCAVALLKPEGGAAVADHESNHLDTAPRQETKTGGARSWGELPYAAQAALACNDPVFRAYLNESFGYHVTSTDEAARAIRDLCDVGSRSALLPGTHAGAKWAETWISYGAWKIADQVAS